MMDDYIFDFIYRMALNDATMQKAYMDSKEELLKNCVGMKECVKDYIRNVLDGNNPDFDKAIENVLCAAVAYRNFTFGNAQKLINMTAKYFYISTYNDDRVRNYFRCCHCPMDRFMIDKIVSEYKEAIKKDLTQKSLRIEYYLINDKELCDWAKVSWSNLVNEYNSKVTSRQIYDKYQMMVKYLAGKKGVMPLELDYLYF